MVNEGSETGRNCPKCGSNDIQAEVPLICSMGEYDAKNSRGEHITREFPMEECPECGYSRELEPDNTREDSE